MVGDHKNNRIRWSTNLNNIGPDGITKIMPPLIATVTTNKDSASPPHAHSHLFHTILNLSKVQTLFDTLVTMFITLGFAYSTPPASKSPAPNMDLGAQDQKKNPKSEGLQWDLRT